MLISVLAFTDRHNGPPPPGLVPLAIFVLILGIGAAFGSQTGGGSFRNNTDQILKVYQGYAINPARDLGPRILTAMVGYGSQGLQLLGFYVRCADFCPKYSHIEGKQLGLILNC